MGPARVWRCFTALASLLLNRPVRHDVAMTGEITFAAWSFRSAIEGENTCGETRGHHGSDRSQAKRKGPSGHSDEVRNTLKFHFVKNVDEALRVALGRERSREEAEVKRKEAEAEVRKLAAPFVQPLRASKP